MSFTPYGKPSSEPHALFLIARDHFVGGRVAFVAGAAFAAQLAMHQCIETGVKAIIKATTPGRKFGGASGHRLRAMLTEVAVTSRPVAALLDNRDASQMIDVLESGYNQIRYGQGILGTDLGRTLKVFDRIAIDLLNETGRVLGYRPGLRVLVYQQALSMFLWQLTATVTQQDSISEHDPWVCAEVLIEAQLSQTA